MVYVSSSVVVMVLLSAIEGMLCDPRTSRLKSYLQAKDRASNQGNCFQAFNECSKSGKCRAALRGLDRRCKVISGRCGAAMVDLTRCGQIMDHIFSFGFPDERCSCPEDSQGCSTMLNKVYSNPCFTSIRHLRKKGLFPKEINAYDRVSKIQVTTTQSPSTTALKSQSNGQVDEKIKLALFEEVFGEKKSAGKATLKRPSLVSFAERTNKVLRSPQEKSKTNAENNPRKEVTTNPRFKAEQTARLQKALDDNVKRLKLSDQRQDRNNIQTRKSPEEVPRETDVPVEKLTEKESTDFRSIAIILAILLGIIVSGATVFLVWTRFRTAYFYTSAKFVHDQRNDEDNPTKIQLSPTKSTDTDA